MQLVTTDYQTERLLYTKVFLHLKLALRVLFLCPEKLQNIHKKNLVLSVLRCYNKIRR